MGTPQKGTHNFGKPPFAECIEKMESQIPSLTGGYVVHQCKGLCQPNPWLLWELTRLSSSQIEFRRRKLAVAVSFCKPASTNMAVDASQCDHVLAMWLDIGELPEPHALTANKTARGTSSLTAQVCFKPVFWCKTICL